MDKTELVIFTICGQEFRIRVEQSEARRTKRVADAVTGRIGKHRGSGSNSDLRAALMTAIELAYELDESQAILDHTKQDKTIEAAKTRMDLLLARLEKEMAAPDESPETAALNSKTAKKHKGRQLDLTDNG